MGKSHGGDLKKMNRIDHLVVRQDSLNGETYMFKSANQGKMPSMFNASNSNVSEKDGDIDATGA